MNLLNLEYVNEITGGDDEMLKELLSTFNEQVLEMKQHLPSLLKLDNIEDIRQLAHKFKSSMRVFGIELLASQLEYLEHNASDLSKETMRGKVDEILEQGDILLDELKLILES